MNSQYRLTVFDLYDVLETWNAFVKSDIFVVACGGTALTLYGHKESTKDVDFLIPNPEHFKQLVQTLNKNGYKQATGYGYKHPDQLWIFDLFCGQRLFQTDLLDPVQDAGKHRIIKSYTRLTLACLNPDDLIISKMFRGDMVDVDDSVILIKAENLNLSALAERYKETASYYYNPPACKTHLGYLIDSLTDAGIDATPLIEMRDTWTP